MDGEGRRGSVWDEFEGREGSWGDRGQLHMSDCHTRRVTPAVAAAFTLIKFPQAVGPIL